MVVHIVGKRELRGLRVGWEEGAFGDGAGRYSSWGLFGSCAVVRGVGTRW